MCHNNFPASKETSVFLYNKDPDEDGWICSYVHQIRKECSYGVISVNLRRRRFRHLQRHGGIYICRKNPILTRTIWQERQGRVGMFCRNWMIVYAKFILKILLPVSRFFSRASIYERRARDTMKTELFIGRSTHAFNSAPVPQSFLHLMYACRNHLGLLERLSAFLYGLQTDSGIFASIQAAGWPSG